jgi:hypothetical protein
MAAVLAIKVGLGSGPIPLVAALGVFVVVLVGFMGLWLWAFIRFKRRGTV